MAIPASSDAPIELEVSTELVAAPKTDIGKLVDAVTELAIVVKKSELSRKRDRVVYLTLIFVLLIVGIPTLVGTIKIFSTANAVRNSQITNQDTNKQTSANSALIKDCVEPTGICYKRNQSETASLIALAVDANHDGKLDVDEILAAINADIAAHRATP